MPSRSLKRALPWLFLIAALAVSLILINGTGPSACDEIPQAFAPGMQTDVGGDDVGIYSSCEVSNTATGATEKVTEVNWGGLLAALSLSVSAWLLGAILGGIVDRRRGAVLFIGGVLVLFAALAATLA